MEMRDSLAEVGEYSLHHRIARCLNAQIGADVVGDDAAVVALEEHQRWSLLVSTDRLAAGVPPQLRAKLLVAQTLSDVICMGGTPLGLLVAVQWPRSSSVADSVEFIQAVEQDAVRYGCHLIGGDTKEGKEFAAVGTAVAIADPDKIVRRTPAADKDLVVVTSAGARPWGARWAYQLVTHYDLQLAGGLREQLATSDLEITLPFAETPALVGPKLVRAGLDLSDGIGASLRIMSEANHLGFNVIPEALDELIDPATVPVTDALGLPLRALALSPGYMWENMYTVRDRELSRATRAVEAVGGKLTVIGEASDRFNGVLYGGRESEVIDGASDEKFRQFAWEDRVSHWVQTMRTAEL